MTLPIYSEKNDRPLSGVRRVIAVAAGKGGVGKSTVAVNLAYQLKARGASVGIMDADVYGPSIAKMLPVDKRPSKRGNLLIPAESFGIKIMSMAYFRREGEASAVRAPVANGIIGQFIEQISWGNLDYLLVDFPPGTGDVQLTLAQKIAFTGAVMVTTPQQVAVIDVRKAIDLFRQVHVPILGVIENMSYFPLSDGTQVYPFGKEGGRQLAETEKIPFLGEIPVDPALSEACDLGKPLSDHAAFMDLAKQIDAVVDKNQNEAISMIIENQTLRIDWGEGGCQTIPLSELQKNCPCAACRTDSPQVSSSVTAQAVDKVGRYAVRIAFDSGCASGIYELSDLRNMGGVHA